MNGIEQQMAVVKKQVVSGQGRVMSLPSYYVITVFLHRLNLLKGIYVTFSQHP